MPSQDDREKFKRLAEKRVNNAIKNIRLIGNLSNRSNYSYTSGDVDKIFKALDKELKHAKSRFKDDSEQDERPFRLT